MKILICYIILLIKLSEINSNIGEGPVLIVNTWKFTNATKRGWEVLNDHNKNVIDAIEAGCQVCEVEQCDHTVGFGGSPDENGEVTLDAMIFDGTTMNMGSVAGLRRIKSAISVARAVLEHTKHSLLVGDLATKFAIQIGFKEEPLNTEYSDNLWHEWKSKNCQPNFWIDMSPDPSTSCGPYNPLKVKCDQCSTKATTIKNPTKNHDTIGMIAIDKNGRIAAGTSTNGAKFKIPGRVGDSPIVGAGAFADSTVGAAVATGDGDIMMRFAPCSTVVELLRTGVDPKMATRKLIKRMVKYYPKFSGAILAVTKDGQIGAACHGLPEFPFSIASNLDPNVKVHYVNCL